MEENNTNNQPVAPEAMPQSAPAALSGQSNKKIILISSIVGGVVLIGITILVLFLTVFAGPSQKDYQDAQAAVSKVVRNFNTAGSAVNSLSVSAFSSSSTSANSSKQRFQSAFDDYKQSVADLKELKALDDEDIKKDYEAFISGNEKFTAYVDGFVGSFDDIANVGQDCDTTSSLSSISSLSDPDQIQARVNTALQPCIDAMKKLSSSKNSAIATYGKDASQIINDMKGNFEDLVTAAKTNDLTTAQSAYRLMLQNTTKFQTMSSKLRTTINTDVKNIDVRQELTDLQSVIADKVQ